MCENCAEIYKMGFIYKKMVAVLFLESVLCDFVDIICVSIFGIFILVLVCGLVSVSR